ncbi:nucleolar protein 7-like [Acanthaster planci]|uniref:Nucleolar protein 7-like n=1 Tax=Acanthaster planci TaxID=133434 RepID=A0A8B7Z6N3_ACAPL|nr:nucleolar protein 7-like [Acanthaster planci]
MVKTRKSKTEASTVDTERHDEMEIDDEAPEAVSFSQGRQEALESISNALKDLQRTKLKAKEKRRERDKLLKEQKQKKKVSLSKARLPAELLDKLAQPKELTSEISEKSQTESSPQGKLTVPVRNDDDDEDSDFEEFDEEKEPTTIQVIQRSKVHNPSPNEATLQFLQNQMYGSRIPRESMAKNVSRKLKRYGKPGMNFCLKKPQGMTLKKKRENRT